MAKRFFPDIWAERDTEEVKWAAKMGLLSVCVSRLSAHEERNPLGVAAVFVDLPRVGRLRTTSGDLLWAIFCHRLRG